ncbi:hypothetical protein EJB05_28576, partial [Eragrostis curvula]
RTYAGPGDTSSSDSFHQTPPARMPGKVAVLLLIFVVFFSHHVSGNCTEEQKTAILGQCEEYIKPGSPLVLPSYLSPCCDKVRLVPGRDMACIVRLLTRSEKNKHSDRKILRLEELCVNPDATPPPRLHRQVMA